MSYEQKRTLSAHDYVNHALNNCNLDEEDATRYSQIMMVLSSDMASPLHAKLLHYYLSDTDLHYFLRKDLAEQFPDREPSRLWNWRWLEGDALYTWGMRSPLDEAAFSMVIKNKSLTLQKMSLIFRRQHGVRRSTDDRTVGARRRDPRDTYAFRDGLLAHASSPSLKDFEIPKVMEMLQTFNMSIIPLAGRLRVIYDLDESIPDSWVEKMFTT